MCLFPSPILTDILASEHADATYCGFLWQIRNHLISLSSENTTNLLEIQKCIFILVLDDHRPMSMTEVLLKNWFIPQMLFNTCFDLPVSSADVERSFSKYGTVLSPICRSMSIWTVCVLIAQYLCWLLTVLKVGCVLCMPKWHENFYWVI